MSIENPTPGLRRLQPIKPVEQVARDILVDSAPRPRLVQIGTQRVHSVEVSGDTDLAWYDEPVYGPEDVVA